MKGLRKSQIALLALIVLLNCRRHERPTIIATTTSLDGSGLLQIMRVEFGLKTGIALNAFVVGSGRALLMASEGRVDLTITHDPDAEAVFVAQHRPELHRRFMWNEFVIVGPQADPAGVSRVRSAAAAFRRIQETASKFLSRNDQSGTNMQELSLWRAAGVLPSANPNYLPIGQPMAQLLRSADELNAYALTDRATFDELAPALHLVVLFAGDPTLRNVYSLTLMRGADSEEHRNARAFANWLLSSDGRRIVESFQIRGRHELHWME
jgi:tungstate transport system substrate-binding protein